MTGDFGLSSLSGAGGLLAAADRGSGGFWFPPRSSEIAPAIDVTFHLIFWISLIFFIAIVVATIIFVVKYRKRDGHKVEKSPAHNKIGRAHV